MPRVSLSDKSVRALKPPEKGQVTYWDKSLKGFVNANLKLTPF